jgi:hypothetical protein
MVPGTIARWRDLVGFEKARYLARMIGDICATGKLAREHVIRNKMRRKAPARACGLSVVANVAEGFEYAGDREFQETNSACPAPSCGSRRPETRNQKPETGREARSTWTAPCGRVESELSVDVRRAVGTQQLYFRAAPKGIRAHTHGCLRDNVGRGCRPYELNRRFTSSQLTTFHQAAR